jgi:putative membrane protein
MSDSTRQEATGEKATNSVLDLAVERTQLAYERTHLAWIRTMFALMTAGLAIDKGVAFIHQQRVESGTAWIKNAHFIGLSLTSAGTILLLVETAQYIMRTRQLAKLRKARFYFLSPGTVLSFLVILLGFSLTLLIILTG